MALHEDRHDPRKRESDVALCERRYRPHPMPGAKLATIVSVIAGWDTITNPEAGVVGRDVEGRAAFETRRRQSVALNGLGPVAAIYSRVMAVDGVIDALVEQNVTDEPISIGTVALKPHSVYVSVVGGEDADVAQAIARSKSAGSDMNGNTSYTVIDAVTGAQQLITFERPDSLRIGVRVTLGRDTDDAVGHRNPHQGCRGRQRDRCGWLGPDRA